MEVRIIMRKKLKAAGFVVTAMATAMALVVCINIAVVAYVEIVGKSPQFGAPVIQAQQQKSLDRLVSE